jgi:serine/threonine protein phosphatase PrpC
MKIFELTQIGEFHINHNEDFLIVNEIDESIKLIAVMDGCSSGIDAHFASILIGKILKKIASQQAYKVFAENKKAVFNNLLKTISFQLFEELQNIFCFLDLKREEILSTLILAVIDVQNKKADILIVGDGLVVINDKIFEFENDNKPDYIGYHLNSDKETWYEENTAKLSFTQINNLVISTDGIFTFKNFDGKTYPNIDQNEINKRFFSDESDLENPKKLFKCLLELKDEYGISPSDDLTMIRIILE